MYKKILGFLLLGIIFWLNSAATQDSSNKRVAKSDSLLDNYSIEDLLEYREYYKKQIDDIEKDRKALKERGIKDAEYYLKNNPNSRILDKVIMRLAELYYQESTDTYIENMQNYDQMVEQQEKTGKTDSILVEPKHNFDKSLALYQQIIDNFPQSDLLDDAIYNKAYLLEEMNRTVEAVEIYEKLISEFATSKYVPEALMRIAEYYFNPPLNNIEKSIDYYKQILEFKDSPKYDEALYRLGWCYYRINNYTEAVSYFTLLADDVNRAKEIDPGQLYSNPVLRDESIEYIGISFLDYGGSKGAADYIKSIGGREYGVEILKKIGDVYKDEKEEYEKAIETYQLLLKMYTTDKQAPVIQEKIVDCYRYLRDDMMAYLARNKLFDDYKPGSLWWQKNEDEDLRDKTALITERALRDNINLLYQNAEKMSDLDLYLQAVNDSKKYLKSFPTDSNAKLIHWNMVLTLDMKLKDYDQAFEEYMKICDMHWNTKYQKFAAENAIALAKDLAAADTTKKKIIEQENVTVDGQSSALAAVSYQRIELTENEKKLARAYDNYIKIYPHEPQTAVILSNAGALYYNNNQFPEALKYFNTIVKHFPDSRDANYAMYMTMESYFGKRDFQSSEIVARRLKNIPNADPELIRKAKERLAASIYLAADVFADSANHLAAGNEYIRVVMEVPDAEFADLSLFNAALEYDKAKEFRRSVETYNYLIETRPNSKFLTDVMNNLAIDYGELGEFKNAALTYEKLSYTAKDSIVKYDALYNSSLFFVKAEEWEDAIRINKNFVEQYPKSEDADDLFFDVATYYLKLNDLENANKIYGEYVYRYPSSPRVVETYFHRGEFYQSNNEAAKAIVEYNKAVEKNDEFKRNKLVTNDYFAAEALFNITKLKYDEYCQIEFFLPQSKMEQDKEKKKNLLKEIIDGFSRVASFGTLRLYESTYYIGDSYEDFAEKWARQEIPNIDETQKIILQKDINQTSAELFGRAEKSYKQAVKALTKLADQYEQEVLAADTTSDENRLKFVSDDSTLRVAHKWVERCKEKISEVIYDVAELNLNSVNTFLQAPIPPGLDNVAEMEYRKQVLGKAVSPLIKVIVDAHTRNVQEAWEMGLENQWVKLSRSKIIGTNNILSNEYHKLSNKALTLYESNSAILEKLVAHEKSNIKELDAVTISEQMANLIDFGRVFANVALDLDKKTVEKSEVENISDPIVSVTKTKMMQELYLFTMKCDSLMTIANMNKKKYEDLYKQTENPEYEEALFTYEDNYLSFKESINELLDSGYQISEELNIKNEWTTNILLTLVRLNPDQYSDLLGASIVTNTIFSDGTWLATNTYYEKWPNLEFDDSFWGAAQKIENQDATSIANVEKIWFMVGETQVTIPDTSSLNMPADQPDSSESESTEFANADTMTERQQSDTMSALSNVKNMFSQETELLTIPSQKVYFRKQFNIEGLPVSAELKLSVDDSYNLFLNGEYIAASKTDSADWQTEKVHQLTDYIKSFKNILAIEGINNDKTNGGLLAELNIKSVPDWDRMQEKFKFETSSESIKRNLVMDKYIIIN